MECCVGSVQLPVTPTMTWRAHFTSVPVFSRGVDEKGVIPFPQSLSCGNLITPQGVPSALIKGTTFIIVLVLQGEAWLDI